MELHHRIGAERRLRHLSYEALAKRMGEVGCAIQPSAIHRIEKGNPPRSIKVEELIAFTKVFGLDSVDEMLVPFDLVQEREVRRLLDEVLDTGHDLATLFERMITAWTQLFAYFAAGQPDSEFLEFVNSHLGASEWSPHSIGARIANQLDGAEYGLEDFRKLVRVTFGNFAYAAERIAGHRVAPEMSPEYLVTYTGLED